MNPLDIIFQSIAQLTGGLITDMTTAIVGLFAVSFIGMGADFILELFERQATRTSNFRAANKAFNDLDAIKQRPVKSRVEIDLAQARYKAAVRRYANDY